MQVLSSAKGTQNSAFKMTNTNTEIIYALKAVGFGLSSVCLYDLFHLLQAVSPELAPTRLHLLQRWSVLQLCLLLSTVTELQQLVCTCSTSEQGDKDFLFSSVKSLVGHSHYCIRKKGNFLDRQHSVITHTHVHTELHSMQQMKEQRCQLLLSKPIPFDLALKAAQQLS